jgi:hypothetical protein
MTLPPPPVAAASAGGVGARLLASYLRALAARPMAVNAATGALTASLGDLFCQLAVERGPYSARRTAEMAAVRAGFMAPFLTLYFPALARTVPGTGWRAVTARLVLDQALGAPLTISVTFALAAALQGRPETALPRIQQQLLPTLATSVCFWPIVHSFNFRLMPVAHQPLVAHVASLFWNSYLAFASNVVLEMPPPAAAAAAATQEPAAAAARGVA